MKHERGRPKTIEGRTEPLTVRVPEKLYDRMCKSAKQADIGLAEFVRKKLEKHCR